MRDPIVTKARQRRKMIIPSLIPIVGPTLGSSALLQLHECSAGLLIGVTSSACSSPSLK